MISLAMPNLPMPCLSLVQIVINEALYDDKV